MYAFWILLPTTYKTSVMFLSVSTLAKLFFFSGLSCFNFFCPCHITISEYIPEVSWYHCFTSLFQHCQSLPLFLSLVLLHWVNLARLDFLCPWYVVSTSASFVYHPFLPGIHCPCPLSFSWHQCIMHMISCGAILSSSEPVLLYLQGAALWPPSHPTCASITLHAVSLHEYLVH